MSAPPGTLEAAEEHFRRNVADLRTGFGPPQELDLETVFHVFSAQSSSRHVDLIARRLRAGGHGFYTIGSAGHEANAWVAEALRPTDPALLHYRSGAFYCTRARQVPGVDPIEDILLGVLAATREPIAGGRHKVFGRKELSVMPQTSTIASHLPRAFGLAVAIGRGVDTVYPDDSVVVCSFGDASLNHSTATGTLNAVGHAVHRNEQIPLLLVCEDNGLGISVPSPEGWTVAALNCRPGIEYLHADGSDPVDIAVKSQQAVAVARHERRPVILHLRTVRYGGHAGTDVETSYRDMSAIRADYDVDPILGTARLLVESFGVSPDEVLDEYDHIGDVAQNTLASIGEISQLDRAADVMQVIAPRNPTAVRQETTRLQVGSAADVTPLTLAQSINRTLDEALATSDDVIVFGEDVGVKGGVYGVTRGLAKTHTNRRVFDTLLDEQTILGLALGAANAGLLPVPEIQYLAYLHNAEDQLRGEAATIQFFSQGAYRNGMVVRIAGYGYQKGFGGHFHNDNAIAVLRDIPGLVIASPSRPDDAAAMLRTCLAAGRVDGTVSAFLEPIALYHTADLYEEGDRGWLQPLPGDDHVPIGSARVHCNADDSREDLLIVTYANGAPMSLRAARRLAREGITAKVLDMRWLSPLPIDDILAHSRSGRVLVVDETRRSGGVSEGVMARLLDSGYRGLLRRVTSKDSFIPLGDAALSVLLGEDEIVEAARDIVST